jgi:ribosomal protein S27AE
MAARWYAAFDRADLLALLDRADDANPGVLATVWRDIQEDRRYLEVEGSIRRRMAYAAAETRHCDRCGPTTSRVRQVRIGGRPNGRWVCGPCWPAEFLELIGASIAARDAAPKRTCPECGQLTPVLDGRYEDHYRPGRPRLCEGSGETGEPAREGVTG